LTSTSVAKIDSVKGITFNLVADKDYISTPDGGSYMIWGFGIQGEGIQYPGPTLDVNELDTITINLTNNLPLPVSILFPGQTDVTPSCGTAGVITMEATPMGGTVTYTFTAAKPGTYMYNSGTMPELQTELGLVGALIVRPQEEKWAYSHIDSQYDYEYMFLLTEMDPKVHELAMFNRWSEIDLTEYYPVLWFINGRNAPDTILPAFTPMLPTQPYNCLPIMHPGDRILLRFIGAGRDPHPFHTHGNNFSQIARDGRLLSSGPGQGADLAVSDNTLTVVPGQTSDVIFTWTGEKMGWDIYGHDPNDPLEPNEYEPDHGKPFPVVLPDKKDLTFGIAYSGSPFLGALGDLPPGEGGFNLNGGYFHMWHSHNEKEIVNYGVFPGGIMTLLIVEPWGVTIAE
jgi:FtsP/CotA-like multicopper oxidase with cupredoxin domain